ncbi:hypothetical protein ACE6H2_005698 [Prunus campanulata]
MSARDGDRECLKEQMETVLASSPHGCVNRCMDRTPCTPTLVVSPRPNNNLKAPNTNSKDTGYYSLAWNCQCGDNRKLGRKESAVNSSWAHQIIKSSIINHQSSIINQEGRAFFYMR